MNLGKELKKKMESKGFIQADLVRQIPIHNVTLGKIFNNDSGVVVSNYEKVAKFLGCKIKYTLEG